MTKFYKIPRYAAVLLIAAAFYAPALHASSFSYSPDTLTFTPTSPDSVIAYVRIAYTGDTSGPGTYIHARISEGSSYFGVPTDTVHTRSYFYLRVAYKPQSTTVYGMVSISDDTVTRTVYLIGNAYVQEDGYLSGVGPYFPTNVLEGHDTCTTMQIVNTGSDHDTIISAGWAHNPNGIFTWDSVSLPLTMPSHDTIHWTFCFNAPYNTTLYTDTFIVRYHDSASQTRIVSRVVSAQAYVPEDGYLYATGPYFPTNVLEGQDTCTTMRLINYGADHDTVISAGWTHNPNGIFTWDTVSLPITMPSHDTVTWTFCFNAPYNTNTYTDTFVVYYRDSASQTRYTTRVISAAAVAPSDGELQAEGPYFPTNIPEGYDTCTYMRLVNSGTDVDTVESMTWSHNPNGIFTWDSVSLPLTMSSHDTAFWTYCFNAPYNTTLYMDTVTIRYHDAAGQSRYDTRIVYGQAYVPTDGTLNLYSGPYFPEVVYEGRDTCSTMRVINSGSDLDTIVSAAWSHDPNGIFTWDSVSLPTTIGSHDTSIWTFCFNAPYDTNIHTDTFVVHYHDQYSHDRYAMRVISGKATDASIVSCYSLYANSFAITNVGDTSYVRMYIHNNLHSSTELTGVHISGTDDGAFRVDSSSFPITIDSNNYGNVLLKFIPNRRTGSSEYTSTLVATFSTTDTSHCRTAEVSLVGYMPQSCSDTETVDIDTTGIHDVDITGDSVSYYAHRIDIVNNTSSTITVTNVRFIDSTTHFYIYQTIPATPDTLAPGQGMAVIVHFYGDTGQTYYDTLAVTVQNGTAMHGGKGAPLSGPSTFFISMKGHQTPTLLSAVHTTAQIMPNLELYPNPSAGIVNFELDGASSATYEVIDILGHVIANHTGSGLWKWDASMSDASDGTYFIRATTLDASGNALTTTKRFVLAK